MIPPSIKINTFSLFWHQLGIATTIAIISCLYLPRFLTIGTFIDGPTYAALARNMAVNYGSCWAPQYGEADSFWLEGVRGDVFYEHPPLMLIVESLLFRLLGDHWWIEELFSALITSIFFWLLLKVWTIFYTDSPQAGNFSWLIILTVSTIPVIRFCMTSNYLDSLLLVLLMFSFYQLCRALRHQKLTGFYWAGIGIFLGFLTKGPFAVFLLAAPILYWLSDRPTTSSFSRALGQTTLLTIIFCVLMGGLLSYAPARFFFTNYFNQQIIKALQGTRLDQNDATVTGLGRFYVLFSLARNLLPLLVLTSLSWGWVHWRLKRSQRMTTTQYHLVTWIILIGFSAIIPIMASQKQNAHYIATSVPFFTIALTTLLVRSLIEWQQARPTAPTKQLQLLSLAGILLAGLLLTAAFLHFNFLTGTLSTHVSGIKQILSLQHIPAGSLVAVTDRSLIKNEGIINMSLQRFHRISLTMDTTRTPYRLSLISQCPIYARDFTAIEQVPDFDIQFWRKKSIEISQVLQTNQ